MTIPNYPWRRTLASWPIPWRQMWGDRANELAESGVVFPQDEILAFEEVNAIKAGRAAGKSDVTEPVAKDVALPGVVAISKQTVAELPFS